MPVTGKRPDLLQHVSLDPYRFLVSLGLRRTAASSPRIPVRRSLADAQATCDQVIEDGLEGSGRDVERSLHLRSGGGAEPEMLPHPDVVVRIRKGQKKRVLNSFGRRVLKRHRRGRLPVSARTSDLLDVLNEACRQPEVGDPPDIGPIHAHAQCRRGADHRCLSRQPMIETAPPVIVGQSFGVVCNRRHAIPGEVACRRFCVRCGQRVCDSGLIRPDPGESEERRQPTRQAFDLDDLTCDIGSVRWQSQDIDGVPARSDLLLDVVDHPTRGGGGHREDWSPKTEPGDDPYQAPIRRPEVVSPLADTMGFVNDHSLDQHLRDESTEQVIVEPFRREKQQIQLSPSCRREHGTLLLLVLRTVDIIRPDPEPPCSFRLLAHQGLERLEHEDDSRGPGASSESLIAEGLSVTRRRYEDEPAPVKELQHDFRLPFSEVHDRR